MLAGLVVMLLVRGAVISVVVTACEHTVLLRCLHPLPFGLKPFTISWCASRVVPKVYTRRVRARGQCGSALSAPSALASQASLPEGSSSVFRPPRCFMASCVGPLGAVDKRGLGMACTMAWHGLLVHSVGEVWPRSGRCTQPLGHGCAI